MGTATTSKEWSLLSMAAKQRAIRTMLDSTPPNSRLAPDDETFFRDVLAKGQGPRTFVHIGGRAVLADGEPWSWKRAIDARASIEKDAARNTFNIDCRPPRTACVDCGARGEECDHVAPSFQSIVAELARPIQCCRTNHRWYLTGESRHRFIKLHAEAKMEWTCKLCHGKRTRERGFGQTNLGLGTASQGRVVTAESPEASLSQASVPPSLSSPVTVCYGVTVE